MQIGARVTSSLPGVVGSGGYYQCCALLIVKDRPLIQVLQLIKVANHLLSIVTDLVHTFISCAQECMQLCYG